MESLKTKRLKRRVAKQKEYLKAVELSIAKKRKDTPTYAQWQAASPEERVVMSARMNPNRINRAAIYKLRRKK